MSQYEVSELLEHWHSLESVPVNQNDQIQVSFLDFPVGTKQLDILEWFQRQHPAFSVAAALDGEYNTIFDTKIHANIELEYDPRGQLLKYEANEGDVSDIDRVWLVEAAQDEFTMALDEIKDKILWGMEVDEDAREHGETAYSFEIEDVELQDPIRVEILQDKMNEHLEAVVSLVLKHMDNSGLKEEDNQGLAIVNRIQDVMQTVNGIAPSDIKTDKTIPVIISASAREGAELDEEDETIPGRYLIRVPANIPDEHLAAAALDSFHCRIGINVLDDFEITVRDGRNGDVIEDHGGSDSYHWSHLELDVQWLDAAPEDDPLMSSSAFPSPNLQ